MKKKPVTIHCFFSPKIEDILENIDIHIDSSIAEELDELELEWYKTEDFSVEVT